jgi:hypothetical protein
VEESQLIDAADSEVVARGMKCKGEEGFIRLEFFLYLEVEHSQKLAAEILVVPDPYRAV